MPELPSPVTPPAPLDAAPRDYSPPRPLRRPSRLRAELRRIVLVGGPILMLGFLAGAPLAALGVALAVLLGWHLYQLHQLDDWLTHRRGYPSTARTGLWAGVSDALYGLQRRNRKRRKRVRKMLKRFRQAAEALPEAAVILDADLGIVSLNPASERLFGLRRSTDVGQPVGHLFRSPAFAEYLARGDFERPLHVASPADRDLDLQVVVVPYGANQKLLLARDVTRLSRLEQMRTDLVANVSHELRSPLTVIVGYVEALEDYAALDADARHAVEQIRAQSTRMCAIVEDLLHLSRLEANPDDAKAEPVDVAALLASVRDDALGLDMEGLEARIDVAMPAGTRLLGEYPELYSALSNLALNAVRHTPAGGKITLATGLDGGALFVDVRDTGIGIEAHHLPRLTERFYRVDRGRSREDGGTGLGLAIVKHALARHDATLEIDSTPGEGSTFRCVFPASRVRLAAAAEPVAAIDDAAA